MEFSTKRIGRAFIVCAVGLSGLAPPAAAQEKAGRCELCEAGAELISRFQLREAPSPVRERDGWLPPVRIVMVGSEGVAAVIRRVAPNAEVMQVSSARAAAKVIAGADVYVGQCTRDLIEAGVDLKWIQVSSAGVERCARILEVAERGILVTNMQRIYGAQIAEHAIAMMLALARALPRYAAEQAAGHWSGGGSQIFEPAFLEVGGKTMLVVGLGGIGTEVAKRASGLGMRVQATRNSRREGPEYVEYVGLAYEAVELAANADVVVNATPLTPDTRGMFDAAFFAAMKETAYFINVGRGASVVTSDLVAALESGAIAGAGLDVTYPEPLPPGHPLWGMPNVILTPHIAAGSDLFTRRYTVMLAENMRRYVAGDRMLSVVDLERGY
ncbi:MAG: D-2-hydroxyacid dehydrogenase [Gemmatimonadota bacterium]|nr:MAG: D-2-hydroxyacid dehydrogenase [Gemmatimonadota bacterium]